MEKERYEFRQRTLFYSGQELATFGWCHLDDVMRILCILLNKQDKEIIKLREESQQLKQSQKQLAIEELKLALDNFRNRPAYFDVARQELCLSEQDKQFIDFINNRIKELGGEKNE